MIQRGLCGSFLSSLIVSSASKRIVWTKETFMGFLWPPELALCIRGLVCTCLSSLDPPSALSQGLCVLVSAHQPTLYVAGLVHSSLGFPSSLCVPRFICTREVCMSLLSQHARPALCTTRVCELERFVCLPPRVVPPFPESRRYLSPFQGNLFSLHCLDFQAEDLITPRWHVGQPCGKASWERLLGKPRGKATDSLIHGKGSATLLIQIGRKAHVHAPTRDED